MIAVRQHFVKFKQMAKTTIVQLNLFTEELDDPHIASKKRIATRIYVIILLASVLTLMSYTSLSNEIKQVTITKPSRAQYESIRVAYPSSFECPCSSVSIKNKLILDIIPIYHQVCSSDLVSKDWLDFINSALYSGQYFCPWDYRANGGILFLLLQTLCREAQQVITDALEIFLQTDLVSAQVISLELFTSKVSASIQGWQSETVKSFNRTYQIIQTIYATDSLLTIYNILERSNIGLKLAKFSRFSDGVEINSTCSCETASSCPQLLGFMSYNATTFDCFVLDTVPGMFMDCAPLQSILESTLECFYNESCMELIYSYYPSGAQSFSLLDSSQSEVFETINLLVSRLFVQRWSTNIFYDNYYQACAPEICTYQRVGRRNFLLVIAVVVSIFGGLNTVLMIIFTILLQIIGKLSLINNYHDRILSLRDLILSLTNRKYLKYRLNIVFLLIILIVLFIFSSLQKQMTTIQIQEPSLTKYEQLNKNYPDSLLCVCSKYSIQYNAFFNVSVSRYHQVCNSDFVSDSWIMAGYSQMNYNQYQLNDFRLIFPSFFKILKSVCELIKEAVNDGLLQLSSTNFINSQVLSSTNFNESIEPIINQFQINTADAFYNTLDLIRRMTGDNTLMSTSQTNWRWRSLANDSGENFTMFVQNQINMVRAIAVYLLDVLNRQ